MEKALKDIRTYFEIKIRMLSRIVLLERKRTGLTGTSYNVALAGGATEYGKPDISDRYRELMRSLDVMKSPDKSSMLTSIPRVLMMALVREDRGSTYAEKLKAVRAVFTEGAEAGLVDLLGSPRYVPSDGSLFDWWHGNDPEGNDEETRRAAAREHGYISSLIYSFAKVHYRFYCASAEIQRLLAYMAMDGRIGPLDAATILCSLATMSHCNNNQRTHLTVMSDVKEYIGIGMLDGQEICYFKEYRTGAAKIIQRAWRAWQESKRSKAAIRIQTAWKRAISNPQYRVCENRLKREFQEDNEVLCNKRVRSML